MENATLIYIVIVLLAFLSNIRRFNKFFIMIKDCYCVEKTPPIYILTKKLLLICFNILLSLAHFPAACASD